MRGYDVDFTKLSLNVISIGSEYCYVFWIIGEEACLIDSGTAPFGEDLVQLIPIYLDYQEFRYFILTHSHYDHIGGAPYVLKNFKNIKVGAHPYFERVLTSQRTVEHINIMNQKELKLFGRKSRYVFEPFKIHLKLKEGDKVQLGNNVVIQVFETPGHTKDSLTYYISPDGFLIPGEALGIPQPDGSIHPQFLSDIDLYINSIEKLNNSDLEINGILFPHERFIIGERSSREYLINSLEETYRYIDELRELSNKLGSQNFEFEDPRFDKLALDYYNSKKFKQSFHAFKLNFYHQLKKVMNWSS